MKLEIRKLALLTATSGFMLLSGCSASHNETAQMIKPAPVPAGFARASDSDQELIDAKIAAQKGLGEFVEAFKKRTPEEKFAIKAPFKEGRLEEHKWVIVDAVKKDEMDGHVERDFQIIKHIKMGQTITVNNYNIEDWAYTDKAGKQHGGFSVEILRKREQPKAN